MAARAIAPNVLFLAVDDLNDWVGCLGGHPQARTPNIYRLAARGALFTNAHCNAPLCNPSRTSVLLGLLPSTSGVHGNEQDWRTIPELKDRPTLPRWFRDHGEATVFWTRMLPIVRTFISLPAGVAEMPFWRFTTFTLLGCVPWVLGLTLIGRSAGACSGAPRLRAQRGRRHPRASPAIDQAAAISAPRRRARRRGAQRRR